MLMLMPRLTLMPRFKLVLEYQQLQALKQKRRREMNCTMLRWVSEALWVELDVVSPMCFSQIPVASVNAAATEVRCSQSTSLTTVEAPTVITTKCLKQVPQSSKV